jgi:cytochrome c peroxidase
MGTVELDRRTPSLWNVGYRKWFGWDGAADSLWMQSLRPILDAREMAGNAAGTAKLLREDAPLACSYRRAFGTLPGSNDEALLVDAAKALAAFEETLVSPRTAFDLFRDALLRGDREAAARYPEAAQRGLRLFIGKGNCSACHFGPSFTNGEFGDVGIPFFLSRPGEVDSGRYGGIERLQASPFNQLGHYNDDASGASAVRTRHVERQHRNFGEFRVPGLRQLGRSGPYMHDGSAVRLEDVVNHYSEVSPDRLHSDGVPLVRALGLSAPDKADLVSFLRSLDAGAIPLPAGPTECR